MLGALTLLLAQASTPSSVVHLQCVTTQGRQQKRWEITLNEAAGMVDYYTEVSGQQRRPARFTADAVYFIGFTLSRRDLTIQRRAFDEVERGICQIAHPEARAF